MASWGRSFPDPMSRNGRLAWRWQSWKVVLRLSCWKLVRWHHKGRQWDCRQQLILCVIFRLFEACRYKTFGRRWPFLVQEHWRAGWSWWYPHQGCLGYPVKVGRVCLQSSWSRFFDICPASWDGGTQDIFLFLCQWWNWRSLLGSLLSLCCEVDTFGVLGLMLLGHAWNVVFAGNHWEQHSPRSHHGDYEFQSIQVQQHEIPVAQILQGPTHFQVSMGTGPSQPSRLSNQASPSSPPSEGASISGCWQSPSTIAGKKTM